MAKLIRGVNDLATVNPELAKQWHPTKNGSLKPTDVTAGCNKKVWWLLPYDNPKTGKHFCFEWESTVQNRNKGIDCPFLTGNAVWPGFNDLATTNPKLAKEWHPTKNGKLTPKDVTANCNKKVWWLLPYDDPKSGKHFDFEWQATIASRNIKKGCPFLSGRRAWPGFNDLATTNPELAAEWHPTKNGKLTPQNVTANSPKKFWWLYSYDDPKTGKHFDFEWQANLQNRNRGSNCPFLNNKAIWQGYNDLATINPELAKQWHPTKNGNSKPTNVTSNSNQKVWWLYPYDDPITGKHFDFEWKATVSDRNNGANCPFLTGNAVWPGFNDLATINPELVKEWHPTKNGSLTPKDITAGSTKKVWWFYPYDDAKTGKHFDFEWEASVFHRNNGIGCSYLVGQAVWSGFNDLSTTNPELAKEWHPTQNGNLTPTNITANSGKKVWWFLPYDDPITGKHFDFEWEATINNRNNGAGCPYISASKNTILIQNLLHTQSVAFVREKIYSNLKDKSYLPFDFLINNKYIIEVDGPQHFESVKHFGGKKRFKETIKHDNIKNQYCYDNNIPLLRIPYIYDPVVDKEKIEQLVLDFTTTGEVPQEIVDFYAQYKFSNYAAYIKSKTLTEAA